MHSIKERSSVNRIEQPSTHSSPLGDVVNVPTQDARVKYVTWLSDDLLNMRFFHVPCKDSPTDLEFASPNNLSDSDDSMPELESCDDNYKISDF